MSFLTQQAPMHKHLKHNLTSQKVKKYSSRSIYMKGSGITFKKQNSPNGSFIQKKNKPIIINERVNKFKALIEPLIAFTQDLLFETFRWD